MQNELIQRAPTKFSMTECEFCGVVKRIKEDETVCRACDDELIKAERKFKQDQNRPHPTRRCQKCCGPVPKNRYFHCANCVPQYETEDPTDAVPALAEHEEDQTLLTKRAYAHVEKSKICGLKSRTNRGCGERKPIIEFIKNRYSADGLSNICVDCNRRYTKAYAAERRERRAARNG